MAFINFFAKETWTHALFNIWNIIDHFVFWYGLFLLDHLMLLCDGRVLLISAGFLHLLHLSSLLDKLLLHWASSGVRCWSNRFSFWLDTFDMMLHVWNPICCVRCLRQQRWSYYISQHWLPIQLNFKRLSLFNDLVDPLAEVFWFEMSTGFWTLIFLPSVIICIDTFIIIEINIFFNISVILGLLFFLLDIILVIIFIRELIQIVLVIMMGVLLLVLSILPSSNLFGVHTSVLTYILLESLAIHFFLCFL